MEVRKLITHGRTQQLRVGTHCLSTRSYKAQLREGKIGDFTISLFTFQGVASPPVLQLKNHPLFDLRRPAFRSRCPKKPSGLRRLHLNNAILAITYLLDAVTQSSVPRRRVTDLRSKLAILPSACTEAKAFWLREPRPAEKSSSAPSSPQGSSPFVVVEETRR